MLEALKEKVRVLGEKMKGLKEKVKAAAGKAVDKLKKRAKERNKWWEQDSVLHPRRANT